MSRLVLLLRARQLRQFLVVSAACGVGGVWVGQHLTPVPGQLFADVAEVPLVYLSPLVLAVSLAQYVPGRTYWIETEPSTALTLAVFSAGLVISFLPPLLTAGAPEVCLTSARNGVLLGCLALVTRSYASAAAATAAVLVPNTVIWTFGWNTLGEPQPWAVTLAAPAAMAPLLLAGVFLAAHLCRVGGLRACTDAGSAVLTASRAS